MSMTKDTVKKFKRQRQEDYICKNMAGKLILKM